MRFIVRAVECFLALLVFALAAAPQGFEFYFLLKK